MGKLKSAWKLTKGKFAWVKRNKKGEKVKQGIASSMEEARKKAGVSKGKSKTTKPKTKTKPKSKPKTKTKPKTKSGTTSSSSGGGSMSGRKAISITGADVVAVLGSAAIVAGATEGGANDLVAAYQGAEGALAKVVAVGAAAYQNAKEHAGEIIALNLGVQGTKYVARALGRTPRIRIPKVVSLGAF